jgi:hypothetical protein
VTRAGDIRGGDRGCARDFAHCARRKRGGNRVGANRGGWSRVGGRPPSGAEWDGGQVHVGCQDGGGNEEGWG